MMQQRLDDLVRRYPALAQCREAIAAASMALRQCFEEGHKLLICGNGGSAADAEHWAGELLKGFCSRRPLTENQRQGLEPALAGKLQQALPVIPLTGFVSLTTAFNNDVDPQLTFAQLVWGLGQPGDVLVCFSTSGNSANVIAAAKVGRARGLRTLGLTGRSGGALAELCYICIQAPEQETYMIQEYHLPIYHTLCLMLEDEFFVSADPANKAQQ